MKKNIVILGGGFGGLHVALSLAHKLRGAGLLDRYQIMLVDRHEYQVYTPLLYILAVPPAHPAAAIDEDRVAYRFKNILKNAPVTFLQGETASIDLVHGDIHLVHGEELTADYLVIATGSESNYFGIPGLQEYSLALKNLEDATKIRSMLSELCSQSAAPRILIGGGGPSGIELAGEIKYNYPHAQVAIAEAAPTLLTGFNSRILAAAEIRLGKLGVKIVTHDPIAAVTPGQVTCKSGATGSFDLLIWTGGVKAPEFLRALPIKTETHGHMEVAPAMLCLPQNLDLKLHPAVYALGDSVCVYDTHTGKPLPGVAPAAIEQGEVAARNILQDIQIAEGMKHGLKRAIYEPREHPYVLPIGGRWAVAKIGPLVFKGFLGWLFKEAIEVAYRWSVKF